MMCSKGGESSLLTLIASCASEIDTPSVTNSAACFRFCGVIKFIAPSVSFPPQRPQLERLDIICSTSFLLSSGRDEDPASPDSLMFAPKRLRTRKRSAELKKLCHGIQ